MPEKTAGFATAIMSGDRSVIKRGHVIALRRSNLVHLLAISGLHMGLLVGVVFAALRWVFMLAPFFILQIKAKKNGCTRGIAICIRLLGPVWF